MSRILARRCSVFRETCANLNSTSRPFSTTAKTSQEASPIPQSILEYRQWKVEESQQHKKWKAEKKDELPQSNEQEKEASRRQQKPRKDHTKSVIRRISSPAPAVKVKFRRYDPITKTTKYDSDTKSAPKSTSPRGKAVLDPEIIAMLSKPTWSVRSLLPPETPTKTITQKQLHHLLRLSALPLPKDQVEEDKMLDSLHSQLHFVSDIQSVNTNGVEPLVRIAEETEEAIKENTIGLEDLRHFLDEEVVIGRNKRRRRIRKEGGVGEGEDWDVFSTAGETVDVPGSGRYFVVRSGKGAAGGDVVV